jgi:TPR repeat protein
MAKVFWILELGVLAVAGVLNGCVLPYPVKPEVEQSELDEADHLAILKYAAVHSPISHASGRAWGEKFTAGVGERIREQESRIEMLDSGEFWRTAFSDSVEIALIETLLEPETYKKLDKFNIDYLCVIDAYRTIDDRVIWVPGLGGSIAERGTSGSVLILDWKKRRIVERVLLSAKGQELVLNVMFYVAGYSATTQTSLKYAMSRILASHIAKSTSADRIVVVLLTATDMAVQSIDMAAQNGMLYYQVIKKGAEEGGPERQMQAYSHLVSTDRNEALYWLCQAADKGYVQALVEVGNLYWRGHAGTSKDLERAFVWYALADKQGSDSWDVWELRQIKQEMTPQQLAEAEQMLADWKPGQCERDLLRTRESPLGE